jgi:hypothetical protein
VITDRVNGALISRTVAVNFTLAARERLNSPCRRLVLAHPLPKSALIFSNDRQADPWNPAELHARKLLRPKADCRRDGTNANTRASEIWGPEFGSFRDDRPIEIFSLLKPSVGGHGCKSQSSILRALGACYPANARCPLWLYSSLQALKNPCSVLSRVAIFLSCLR